MYDKINIDHRTTPFVSFLVIVLGGLVVIVLAIGPKIRGFQPGRGRWIFKGGKNPQHDCVRRGSKAVGPVS
jgi:hypothetical protein